MKKKSSIFFSLNYSSSFTSESLKADLNIYLRKYSFFPFFSFLPFSGDSIFTAGKPAILANNTLIRTSRGLTNRRHAGGNGGGGGGNLTSSSSTISSVSNNNNDRDKECKELIKDKEREIYDNPHHRFISGKQQFIELATHFFLSFFLGGIEILK